MKRFIRETAHVLFFAAVLVGGFFFAVYADALLQALFPWSSP